MMKLDSINFVLDHKDIWTEHKVWVGLLLSLKEGVFGSCIQFEFQFNPNEKNFE